MRLYIAGKYEERFRLQLIARHIEQETHHRVHARWLETDGFSSGNPDFRAVENRDEAEESAIDDLDDILGCHGIIYMVYQGASMTVGRAFELGYAYSLGHRVFIVGEPDSIFAYLPGIQQFDTTNDLVDYLKGVR